MTSGTHTHTHTQIKVKQASYVLEYALVHNIFRKTNDANAIAVRVPVLFTLVEVWVQACPHAGKTPTAEVRSCVRSFVRAFVRSFVRSFVDARAHSFPHLPFVATEEYRCLLFLGRADAASVWVVVGHLFVHQYIIGSNKPWTCMMYDVFVKNTLCHSVTLFQQLSKFAYVRFNHPHVRSVSVDRTGTTNLGSC